jgi:uncharacterized damage-inducible protein DinB
MRIIEWLLPEYDREMGLTRSLLDRVPLDRTTFRPYQGALSLGDLAGHLVHIPSWCAATMRHTQFSLDREGRRPVPGTRLALLTEFDVQVREGRDLLVDASDAALQVPWTLTVEGTALFTMPRMTALRTFVLNRTVHHRGQLTVYLHLLDVPVPAFYGPDADEVH